MPATNTNAGASTFEQPANATQPQTGSLIFGQSTKDTKEPAKTFSFGSPAKDSSQQANPVTFGQPATDTQQQTGSLIFGQSTKDTKEPAKIFSFGSSAKDNQQANISKANQASASFPSAGASSSTSFTASAFPPANASFDFTPAQPQLDFQKTPLKRTAPAGDIHREGFSGQIFKLVAAPEKIPRESGVIRSRGGNKAPQWAPMHEGPLIPTEPCLPADPQPPGTPANPIMSQDISNQNRAPSTLAPGIQSNASSQPEVGEASSSSSRPPGISASPIMSQDFSNQNRAPSTLASEIQSNASSQPEAGESRTPANPIMPQDLSNRNHAPSTLAPENQLNASSQPEASEASSSSSRPLSGYEQLKAKNRECLRQERIARAERMAERNARENSATTATETQPQASSDITGQPEPQRQQSSQGPAPSTSLPTPSTPEPTPSTPKPTPSTPMPTTSTPKPTPSTPKPTPSTPKPAPVFTFAQALQEATQLEGRLSINPPRARNQEQREQKPSSQTQAHSTPKPAVAQPLATGNIFGQPNQQQHSAHGQAPSTPKPAVAQPLATGNMFGQPNQQQQSAHEQAPSLPKPVEAQSQAAGNTFGQPHQQQQPMHGQAPSTPKPTEAQSQATSSVFGRSNPQQPSPTQVHSTRKPANALSQPTSSVFAQLQQTGTLPPGEGQIPAKDNLFGHLQGQGKGPVRLRLNPPKPVDQVADMPELPCFQTPAWIEMYKKSDMYPQYSAQAQPQPSMNSNSTSEQQHRPVEKQQEQATNNLATEQTQPPMPKHDAKEHQQKQAPGSALGKLQESKEPPSNVSGQQPKLAQPTIKPEEQQQTRQQATSSVFGQQQELKQPTSNAFGQQQEFQQPTKDSLGQQQELTKVTGNVFGGHQEAQQPTNNAFPQREASQQEDTQQATSNLFGQYREPQQPTGNTFSKRPSEPQEQDQPASNDSGQPATSNSNGQKEEPEKLSPTARFLQYQFGNLGIDDSLELLINPFDEDIDMFGELQQQPVSIVFDQQQQPASSNMFSQLQQQPVSGVFDQQQQPASSNMFSQLQQQPVSGVFDQQQQTANSNIFIQPQEQLDTNMFDQEHTNDGMFSQPQEQLDTNMFDQQHTNNVFSPTQQQPNSNMFAQQHANNMLSQLQQQPSGNMFNQHAQQPNGNMFDHLQSQPASNFPSLPAQQNASNVFSQFQPQEASTKFGNQAQQSNGNTFGQMHSQQTSNVFDKQAHQPNGNITGQLQFQPMNNLFDQQAQQSNGDFFSQVQQATTSHMLVQQQYQPESTTFPQDSQQSAISIPQQREDQPRHQDISSTSISLERLPPTEPEPSRRESDPRWVGLHNFMEHMDAGEPLAGIGWENGENEHGNAEGPADAEDEPTQNDATQNDATQKDTTQNNLVKTSPAQNNTPEESDTGRQLGKQPVTSSEPASLFTPMNVQSMSQPSPSPTLPVLPSVTKSISSHSNIAATSSNQREDMTPSPSSMTFSAALSQPSQPSAHTSVQEFGKQPAIPADFTDEEERHFRTAWRLRYIEVGLAKRLCYKRSAVDMKAAIKYFEIKKRIILATNGGNMPSIAGSKRKAGIEQTDFQLDHSEEPPQKRSKSMHLPNGTDPAQVAPVKESQLEQVEGTHDKRPVGDKLPTKEADKGKLAEKRKAGEELERLDPVNGKKARFEEPLQTSKRKTSEEHPSEETEIVKKRRIDDQSETSNIFKDIVGKKNDANKIQSTALANGLAISEAPLITDGPRIRKPIPARFPDIHDAPISHRRRVREEYLMSGALQSPDEEPTYPAGSVDSVTAVPDSGAVASLQGAPSASKPPVFELPTFNAGSSASWTAQFGKTAAKSAEQLAKEEKAKRKAEEFDSDEDDEAQWERDYEERLRAKRQKVEAVKAQGTTKLVDGKFVFVSGADAVHTDATQGTPPGYDRILGQALARRNEEALLREKTVAPPKVKNIFGSLPDGRNVIGLRPGVQNVRARSGSRDLVSRKPSDNSSSAEDSRTGDADDEGDNGREGDDGGETDDSQKKLQATDSKAPKKVIGSQSSHSATPQHPQTTTDSSNQSSLGGLFDRVSKDKDGNLIRETPNTPNFLPPTGSAAVKKSPFGSLKFDWTPKGKADTHVDSSKDPEGGKADHTWKPDSTVRFGVSGIPPTVNVTSPSPPKQPFSSFFGAPKMNNTIETPAQPASVLSSHTSQKVPSVSFNFGFTPANPTVTSLAPPSNEVSAATSRATTPGITTGESANESTADAQEDEPKDTQIDLTAGGPGEEDEDVVFEVKGKAMVYDRPSSKWDVKGVGFLRVLKNRETGKTRMLMRQDPSGKILLNTGLAPQFKYESHQSKHVRLPFANESGKIEGCTLRVGKDEDAKGLVGVLEANKSN